MAIQLRSRQQIAKMRAAGRLVAQTFEHLRPHIRPGVTTQHLDRIAEEFIREHGAVPAYKGYREYRPFPATICVALNNVVCHGIPDNTALREGDIIGIDIGAQLDGWFGDSCVTYAVGPVAPEAERLLRVAEECLWRGIRAAKANGRLGDIAPRSKLTPRATATRSCVNGTGMASASDYTRSHRCRTTAKLGREYGCGLA